MEILDLAKIGKLPIRVFVMQEASAQFHRKVGPSLIGATVVFQIMKEAKGPALYTQTNGSGVVISDADNMTITIPPLPRVYDYYYYKMVVTYADGSKATAVDKIYTVYE